MAYVDGFVLPVPKKNIATYRKIATLAGRAWIKHGALEYREAVGEDLKIKFGVPFPKLAKPKAGETVVFAWIVFKSRAHRDKVNAKVMKDKDLHASMETGHDVFDFKRMSYGGFDIIVDETAKKPRKAIKKTASKPKPAKKKPVKKKPATKRK